MVVGGVGSGRDVEEMVVEEAGQVCESDEVACNMRQVKW